MSPIRSRLLVVATALGCWAIGSERPGAQAQGSMAVVAVRVPDGGLQPQAVSDPSGRLHLVYFKGDAANGDLFYVRSDRAAGAFSVPLRVTSEPASAIATGNVRGARLAVGQNGRVHVAWNGSSRARPRGPAGATPMLYARLNDAGTAFEPQRNLLTSSAGLDGGGAIAADLNGRVYVAWHANGPQSKAEGDRRVWVAESNDAGRTFTPERAVSDPTTGACGCCGMAGHADRRGAFYLLYRSARDMVRRDTYLLTSTRSGRSFSSRKLDEWTLGACSMSTYALAEGAGRVWGAWENDGQIRFQRLDADAGATTTVLVVPGEPRTRKHPALAVNATGEFLLAWTEGMGWSRGGAVAWQVFDAAGQPTAVRGRAPGVPAWSLVSAVVRPDGGFTVVY